MTPQTQQLRFLAFSAAKPRTPGWRVDQDLLSTASAVAGRRLTSLDDLDELMPAQVDRLAVQLNRRLLVTEDVALRKEGA